MKRLKKTVPSKNTTRKKNNGGMTYVELLVALSLLVLIVTMFSPMLLSSYDKIYRAGEKTSNAFNAKYSIEAGLAYRADDPLEAVETNFSKFSDNLNIKARRVASVLDGFNLETIYFGAKGKIKVITDSVVSDNQNNHSIKLQITNLGTKIPKSYTNATTAMTPGENEIRFYVHSIFDATVGFECEFNQPQGHNKYIDVLIKGVDVTKSPLKILAYYVDENGETRSMTTYLDIEPADIMFVGKTNNEADYFTSAGFNPKDKSFYIAARKMPGDAAIGEGKTLNDVEWVSPTDDSSIVDGYYLMCGNESIVRRLWRARTTPKTADIVYKNENINGKEYFQYDWKGDYTDRYSYIAKSGAGSSGYGTSSTDENDVPVDKDVYGLAKSSYIYAYNGYSGSWSNLDQSHKRISYIVKSSVSEADTKPENGMWVKWTTHSGRHKGESIFASHTDRILDIGDGAAYNVTNDTWYKRVYKSGTGHYYEMLYKSDGNPLKGLSFAMGSWEDQKNAKNYGGGNFFRRNGVPDGKDWETATSNVMGNDVYEDQNGSYTADPDIAYLMLKIYNNFSSDDLKNNKGDAMVGAPESGNAVNLTSCMVLPNKAGDSIYFGTTKANALINQTNATSATNSDKRKGLIEGHFLISLDQDANGVSKTQQKTYIQAYPEDVMTDSVSPNSSYAVEKLYNGASPDDSDTLENVAFTMGYASDLFAMYNSFSDGDVKPLENSFMASKQITAVNDTVRENIWFPRNFYNILESDSFGKSVVAVGYNVSGHVKAKYNALYYNGDDGTNDTLLKQHHNSNWELNITEEVLINNGWTSCEYNGNTFYYIRGDDDFWLKLPKQVVGSTSLGKLRNDGVISVYNEGDNSAYFHNIYYYRESSEASVRFNCVSTFDLGNNTVGAAVGLSNGSVMLAQIPYAGGKLATTALTADKCPQTGPIAQISSVSAVKGFTYDYDSDNVPEAIILAGGVRPDGQALVLRVCDVTDLSSYYNEFTIQIEGEGSDVSEITDIAFINDYIYVSGRIGTDKGVIFSCSFSDLKKIAGKENSGVPVTDFVWKKTTEYYTNYGFSSEAGVVKGTTISSIPLPVINSIAGRTEQ